MTAWAERLWLYPPSDARHLYCAGGDSKEPSRAAAPPFQRFDELSPELQAAYPAYEHAAPLEVNLVKVRVQPSRHSNTISAHSSHPG